MFGRVLRDQGLNVNPGRMIDLVNALEHIDISKKLDFYYASRSLLVHHKEDLAFFDQAFDLFWGKHKINKNHLDQVDGVQKDRDATFESQGLGKSGKAHQEIFQDEGDLVIDQNQKVELSTKYTSNEILRKKDFAQMTAEELDEVEGMLANLVWKLGERKTRRFVTGPGSAIDLRRTMRQNIRYGGEALEWINQRPKFKPRPLVIIADISGSMEQYTRMLLQFMYGIAKNFNQGIEIFVFSTRLTHISRQVKNKDINIALEEISDQVPDWSGGTRIGDAIKTFNFEWGRRVLGRGSVVLFISDGWDRGDPDLLADEMARLQRTTHRLIWLNPLLGSPDYEPLTRGTQIAIKNVDEFLSIHNLNSLEDLASHLAKLGEPQRISKTRFTTEAV